MGPWTMGIGPLGKNKLDNSNTDLITGKVFRGLGPRYAWAAYADLGFPHGVQGTMQRVTLDVHGLRSAQRGKPS